MAADAVATKARIGDRTPGLKWPGGEWEREGLGGKKALPNILLKALLEWQETL